MSAYSLDLRTRVLADWDARLNAEDVSAKYRVCRAWVHRLVQRRRETGEIGPRRQTKFRGRRLTAGKEDRLLALVTAQPDRTLAELREALPTTASLTTIWRALGRLQFTVKTGKVHLRRVPCDAVSAGVGRALDTDQGRRPGAPLRQWRITASMARHACGALFDLTQRAVRIAARS